MHQVRAVTLSRYVEVARKVGLDGNRMLREVGISREWLEDPEHRLPAGKVLALLDRSAELSGCESFGILLTEARTFPSLGPLSLLLERLANVREVVREATEFQRHLNDIVDFSTDDSGDTCVVRLDMAPAFWSMTACDHIVSMAYMVLVGASGNRWQPDRIHFVRREPADPTPWRQMFHVPIEFDSTFSGLSASRDSMLVPLPLANEVMVNHARRLLRLVHVDPTAETFTERVRRSITLLLPSGHATIERVAAQLGLSSRSLQRRLDEEGHQFAELLNEVRRELATAYLSSSTHPITTVAELLGYSSPSSFTRWFAGSFGSPPQLWRADHANDDIGRQAARRR